jgi:hypothetical protein
MLAGAINANGGPAQVRRNDDAPQRRSSRFGSPG